MKQNSPTPLDDIRRIRDEDSRRNGTELLRAYQDLPDGYFTQAGWDAVKAAIDSVKPPAAD
jgi:hypothetical protein